MGLVHGGWCVGCCWALMAALFALGVMSIGWMAFIAALIAIEKLLPWPALANRGIAVLLLVLGLGVAFAPSSVPGLTLPDSPEAMKAMSRWRAARWTRRRAGRWIEAKRVHGARFHGFEAGRAHGERLDGREAGQSMHGNSDGSMKAGRGTR